MKRFQNNMLSYIYYILQYHKYYIFIYHISLLLLYGAMEVHRNTGNRSEHPNYRQQHGYKLLLHNTIRETPKQVFSAVIYSQILLHMKVISTHTH